MAIRNIIVRQDPASRRFIVEPGEFSGASGFAIVVDPQLFDAARIPQGGLRVESGLLLFISAQGAGLINVGTAITTFAGADPRVEVKGNFDTFLQLLEAREGGPLRKGAVTFLRRAIAHALPSTFAESLYFQYGLIRQTEPVRRTTVDLVPGMRLRLECQFSQLVPGAAADEAFNPFVNGYVPAGQATYDLVETLAPDGTPLLAFDAFLGSGPAPVVDASDGGMGGLIDLSSAALRRRWFRLCYPAKFESSQSIGGTTELQNVTLIGANTLAALEAATGQYVEGRSLNTPGTVAAFFRGRTIVVPEILVSVNESPRYVPVGTTVRQLAARISGVPNILNFGPAAFTLKRWGHGAAFSLGIVPIPNTTEYLAGQRGVTLPAPDFASPDAWDLPVLAGDAYTFTVPPQV